MIFSHSLWLFNILLSISVLLLRYVPKSHCITAPIFGIRKHLTQKTPHTVFNNMLIFTHHPTRPTSLPQTSSSNIFFKQLFFVLSLVLSLIPLSRLPISCITAFPGNHHHHPPIKTTLPPQKTTHHHPKHPPTHPPPRQPPLPRRHRSRARATSPPVTHFFFSRDFASSPV